MTLEAKTSPDTLVLYFNDMMQFAVPSKKDMADLARQLRAQKEKIVSHLCALPSTFDVLKQWNDSDLENDSIYKLFEVNGKASKDKEDCATGIRENALKIIKKILAAQNDAQKMVTEKDIFALSLTPAGYDQLIQAGLSTSEQAARTADLRAARRAYETTRSQMVNQNLRFAVKMAKNYAGRGLALSDLIQEGNIGLIKAVEKYDPDTGHSFSTYAKWWIKQSIERAFDTQLSTIRLPESVRQEVAKTKRASLKLTAKFGKKPTPQELALEMKATPEKVQRYLDAAKIGGRTASLDAPISDAEDAANLGFYIIDTRPNALEAMTNAEDMKFYERLLQRVAKEGEVDAREADIIAIYHLDPDQKNNLTDIARDWGLTKERVRQLEKRAMQKLQLAVDSGNFPPLAYSV